MQIKDWILCLLCTGSAVLLVCTVKRHIALYHHEWRLLYLVPVFACWLHIALFAADWCLVGVYLGALVLTTGFFTIKPGIRRFSSGLAVILCCLAIPACSYSDNYRRPRYTADFNRGFAFMREHYSLSEHKAVDWDALYSEYLPYFEQAEKERDASADILAWTSFCNEFRDAHVMYLPTGAGDAQMEEAAGRVAGSDYGLTLIKLDNGNYVAVLVKEDSQAYAAGIRTGTRIVAWDGRPPAEWEEEAGTVMEQCMVIANEENKQFYESLFIAGIGGEQVMVTWEDEDGKEETAALNAMGSYYPRLQEAYRCLNYKAPKENMSITEISRDTILLNINVMAYDSETDASADYSKMITVLREQLTLARTEGKTNLVIDLRGNSGGSSQMARAIVSLLAEEEGFWAADGVYDAAGRKYVIQNSYYYNAEHLWEDGKIVVLVNSGTNSAANHLAAKLQEIDSVSVVGITEPTGAAQGVTEIPLEYGRLCCSATLVLDETGEVWMDSDESGHLQFLVDERIPLDEEAVSAIFEEKEDYLLNYVQNRLEEN